MYWSQVSRNRYHLWIKLPYLNATVWKKSERCRNTTACAACSRGPLAYRAPATLYKHDTSLQRAQLFAEKLRVHHAFLPLFCGLVGYFPDFFCFIYSCFAASGVGLVGHFPTLWWNRNGQILPAISYRSCRVTTPLVWLLVFCSSFLPNWFSWFWFFSITTSAGVDKNAQTIFSW